MAAETLIHNPVLAATSKARKVWLKANRDGLTLQVSNIARDGRHVVEPRNFPRHAEVYVPPDNWRGMKARKDYKEPGYNRDTAQGAAGSRALADAERVAEAAQPGRKWTGLMRPAITQKDGNPHKIDYTRVGFQTRSFFPCFPAGLPDQT